MCSCSEAPGRPKAISRNSAAVMACSGGLVRDSRHAGKVPLGEFGERDLLRQGALYARAALPVGRPWSIIIVTREPGPARQLLASGAYQGAGPTGSGSVSCRQVRSRLASGTYRQAAPTEPVRE